MYNNYSLEYIEHRRDELYREAEKARLAGEAARHEALRSAYNVLMAEIGRQMVNLGNRLQELDEPDNNFSRS
ncbi:MAG: hypothetical protein SF029_19835 [bacterium]|nr:hypothetical protein [bacterium]